MADDLKAKRDREYEQRQFEKRLRESMALNELARQDAIQQRREAQNNQQERFVNNQGYKAGLGGYRVQDGGSVRIMQSQTNSALPLGVNFADGNSMDAPPAFVFEPSVQPVITPTNPDYWFAYSIEYFDASEALVRTEFWLGGSANLLLATYEVNTVAEIVEFPELSDSSTAANGNASVDLDISGAASLSAETSGSVEQVSFNTQVLPRTAVGGYNLTVELNSSSSGSNSGGDSVVVARSVCQISLRGNATVGLDILLQHRAERNLGGELLQETILGSTSTVASFSNNPVEVFRNQLYIAPSAATNYIGVVGNANVSVNLESSISGVASKTRNALFWYLSKRSGTLYAAIRHHPLIPNINAAADNLSYDYYTISAGTITVTTVGTEAEIDATVTDWRKTTLGTLDAFNAGGTLSFPDPGDACIEAHRFSTTANLDDGVLRTATGDLEILKTQNATIEITQQPATSNGSCSLGAVTTSTKSAVKVADPISLPGETSTLTTIVWAAP